ncbi:lysozyme [Trinickia violacea]|uniref:Lysozyme n=1 Tax=Trinickia violacea TaxID=2571746 RepID=A0A4V1EHC6_9BURK|nr:lysozyme [Trinickia violacea]QCP49800.1 lysozyme [Trinickia violacea]
MSMQMSDHGRSLLTQWEGYRNQAYDDGVGVLTIGVGHALTPTEKSSGALDINGTPVPYAGGISDDQVQALLAYDLRKYEGALNDAIATDLTQNQFDALVSFCFNIGVNGFQSSSALSDVNNNNLNAVPDDLRKWEKAGGVYNQGLANRRENEIKLWLGQI